MNQGNNFTLQDWQQAQRYAHKALAVRNYSWIMAGFNRSYEITVLLRAGDIEAARRDVAGFGQQVNGNPRYLIVHLRCLALLANGDKDDNAAVAYRAEAQCLGAELGISDT